MKEIRVLMLVTNLRQTNGVTSYVMNYFNAVDQSKIHMDFALIYDVPTPYYETITDAGSKVYILPSIKKPLSFFRRCREIIDRGHYDIVHDNILLASLPIMTLAKKKRIPVRILHSHNSKLGETQKKEMRNRLFLPLLLRTVTEYCACSKEAAEAMFGDKEYTFIPNVVSEEKLRFSSERRDIIRSEMGIRDKIVIGTIGRVAPQKNPFFALDVIEETIKQIPNVEYWWIGNGPLDNELKDEVARRGLSDHVRLFGNRNDVVDLYSAIDIFFLPSLFEGLPLTGIEAQAMGLPSVVSDTVTKEMVYTDLVEYVSLDSPIEKWTETIRKQIGRIPQRRSYNDELRDSVFSISNAGKRLEYTYEKMLTRTE